jgi:hypothetical protein
MGGIEDLEDGKGKGGKGKAEAEAEVDVEVKVKVKVEAEVELEVDGKVEEVDADCTKGGYLESYSKRAQWQSVVRYVRSASLRSSAETPPDIAGGMDAGGASARSSTRWLAGRGRLNKAAT